MGALKSISPELAARYAAVTMGALPVDQLNRLFYLSYTLMTEAQEANRAFLLAASYADEKNYELSNMDVERAKKKLSEVKALLIQLGGVINGKVEG